MYYIRFIGDLYFGISGIEVPSLPSSELLSSLSTHYGRDLDLSDAQGKLLATVFDGDVKWY